MTILKSIIIALVLVLNSGCCGGSETKKNAYIEYENLCLTQEEQKVLREFVSSCIENANPKSDEEPEDWIKQCEWTGIEVACPRVKTVRFSESYTWMNVSCSEVTDPEHIVLCESREDDDNQR